MMKTFQQFITEAYDKELEGQASRAPGEGGRIRASRKKSGGEIRGLSKTQLAKKPRTKAVGGGKTAPAKDYKPRKDIGTNKPRSRTQQQPTQDKHTQQLTPKQAQRKAYLERKAREQGATTKTADELLAKKTTKTDPKYKPRKASGKTEKERKALYKKGERTLRDLRLKNLGKSKESELKHRVTSK